MNKKKIINQLLLSGKIATSEKIWLKSIKFFYKLFVKNQKKIINKALINITPFLTIKQLKQKRKRSRLKEFPYLIHNKNRIPLALKFLLKEAHNKTSLKIYKKLINELLLAAKKTGVSVSKKKKLI